MRSVGKVLTKPQWYKLLAIKLSCFASIVLFTPYPYLLQRFQFTSYFLPNLVIRCQILHNFSRAHYFDLECLQRFNA